jgi:hypothetical protein
MTTFRPTSPPKSLFRNQQEEMRRIEPGRSLVGPWDRN